METAILVDWNLFRDNPYTQDFVHAKSAHAKLVLLISDPTYQDYTPKYHQAHPEIDFDVVIRNTGDLPNVAFKTTALSVITEVSNLVPVIGLDRDREVNAMYREAGVLITLEDL
jgi:hypothetical protein